MDNRETLSKFGMDRIKNIDNFRFCRVEENFNDAPKMPIIKSKKDKSLIKVEESPYNDLMLRLKNEFVGQSSTSNLPEELTVLSVLFSHNKANIEKKDYFFIGKIMRLLIDEKFIGIGNSAPNKNYAEKVIGLIKDGDGIQNKFDRCVEIALAVGDVYAAVDLMKKAAQELGYDKIGDPISRLASEKNGVFDKAYDLYSNLGKDSNKLLDRMDGVFIALFDQNKNQLKAKAEERLKQRLIEQRDEWYYSQKVSHVNEDDKDPKKKLTLKWPILLPLRFIVD